jgi:hypothetical protein
MISTCSLKVGSNRYAAFSKPNYTARWNKHDSIAADNVPDWIRKGLFLVTHPEVKYSHDQTPPSSYFDIIGAHAGCLQSDSHPDTDGYCHQ